MAKMEFHETDNEYLWIEPFKNGAPSGVAVFLDKGNDVADTMHRTVNGISGRDELEWILAFEAQGHFCRKHNNAPVPVDLLTMVIELLEEQKHNSFKGNMLHSLKGLRDQYRRKEDEPVLPVPDDPPHQSGEDGD